MTHAPEAWPALARSASAPPLPAARRLELDLDIDQALDDLRRTFPGICIWHGDFVRHEAPHFEWRWKTFATWPS